MTEVNPQNPYLGLQAFSEREKDFFFGRDSETAQLFDRLKREPLTVLFGRSGLGKSSLLEAGLYPLLREAHYFPISIRFEYGPKAPDLVAQIKSRVADEIDDWRVDAPTCEFEQNLWDYFQRAELWSKENWLLTPVLVFDQFEEFFTLGSTKARESEFLDVLADLAENRIPHAVRRRIEDHGYELPSSFERPPAKIIITLREDYLGDLEELRGSIPAVATNRYRLIRMSGTQALEAVVQPAGDLIDEATALEIISFVAGSTDIPNSKSSLEALKVEPSLLSLVCRELNQRRISEKRRTISSELLKGAREDVFVRFYDRCFEGVAPEARCFVEDRLLTDDGLRTTAAYREAESMPGVSVEDIDALVRRRLLRRETRLSIPHLEIIHDVLRDVVSASRERRRERERLVGEQERLDRERMLLEERRHRRRTRATLATLVTVVLLFAILSSVALWQWEIAEQQREIAEQQREIAEQQQEIARGQYRRSLITNLASQATSVKGELGTLLALQAYRFSSEGASAVVEQALRDTLGEPWVTRVLRHHRKELADFERVSNSIAFDSSGDRLFSAGTDGRLVYWDLTAPDDGVQKFFADETVSFKAVAVSPDGRLLAALDRHEHLVLWDLDHLNEPDVVGSPILRTRLQSVAAFAFGPLGARLATGGAQGIEVWDLSDPVGDPTRLWQKQTRASSLAFNGDGSVLAYPGHDGRVCLWYLHESNEEKCFGADLSRVTAIRFSPDGNTLASGHWNGVIMLWDVSAMAEKPVVLRSHRAPVSSLAFSPEGRLLASDGFQPLIAEDARVWNLEDPRASPVVLPGHYEGAQSVAFSRNGTLASADNSGAIRFWRLPSAHHSITIDIGRTDAVVFTPNGQWIIAAGSRGLATVRRFETTAAQSKILKGDVRFWSVTVSPDGRWLASAGEGELGSGFVDVHQLEDPLGSANFIRSLEGAVYSAAFSPDGRTLAYAGWGSIELINAEDGSRQRRLDGDDVNACVAFSPDGNRLATTGSSGKVRLWDIPTGHEIASLWSDDSDGLWVTFSPDGARVASAGSRGIIRLWETDTGKLMTELRGHEGYVSVVAFSPDGAALATAGYDGTLRLWRLDGELGSATILRFDERPVYSVAYDPTGNYLVSGHQNRVVLWPARAALLAEMGCEQVTGNLSEAEWSQFIPGMPYEETCPGLPSRRPVISEPPTVDRGTR